MTDFGRQRKMKVMARRVAKAPKYIKHCVGFISRQRIVCSVPLFVKQVDGMKKNVQNSGVIVRILDIEQNVESLNFLLISSVFIWTNVMWRHFLVAGSRAMNGSRIGHQGQFFNMRHVQNLIDLLSFGQRQTIEEEEIVESLVFDTVDNAHEQETRTAFSSLDDIWGSILFAVPKKKVMNE